MKYLVTGGAGFIASHLVDRLIADGHGVAVIDNLSTGRKENINPEAIFYKMDIKDPGMSDIFKKEKPEIVFHFAAQINIRKSVENPIESASTNILGSLSILENCRKTGVKKIIFSSTGGAMYGDTKIIPTPEDCPPKPVSPYGIEKMAVEHYLEFYKKEYELGYTVLRFANVYGPRQNSKGEAGVVAIFLDNIISKKQSVIYGLGKQTRDFVFVADVIEACALAIDKEGIFNIATSKETDINSIFSKISGLFDFAPLETHAPEKPGEQERSCLDINKAKNILKWEPSYSLDKGLLITKNWFLNFKNKNEHS